MTIPTWRETCEFLGLLADLAIIGYVGSQVVRGVRHLLARRRRELDRFLRPGAAGPANFTEDPPGPHAIRPAGRVG